MSSLTKLNNVKVKPLEVKTKTKTRFKGKKLFELWCPNIFVLARKNSGKTTTVQFMIDKCAGKHTQFVLICSTVEKDPSWIDFIDKNEDRIATFKSIYEDGENVLKQFIDENQSDVIDHGQAGAGVLPIEPPLNNFKKYQQTGKGSTNQELPKEPEVEKWKYPYPKYVIIMDDLGTEMRDPAVTQLLKTNRHYDCMVIMSSQSLTDLDKPARSQLDYMLIFPKIPLDKMKSIKEDLNLSVPLEEFIEMYNKATEEKYNFLYISRNTAQEEYRKNFNERFIENPHDSNLQGKTS
jgi:hypothetical protein